ncbi:alanine--tRNA ligase, cytoplasmic-like [Octopus sinensis]|uniref:Alanine--tRNA ligase n=1 Tax=Octopus sinensis TaxID=2607531 RepID=A0A7E6FJE2_9MOLL|nr:alanine--tRNA ligase, cytoplasmic-like [Octopus sinensis]
MLKVGTRVCHHCQRSHTYSALIHSHKKTTWSSKRIRKTFLDYFCEENGHQFVKSSSVIPTKAAGTYFTNAGMNQFKPIFLGDRNISSEMAHYKTAANSQRCIRVGGKHNDLNDVGKDLYHHTFFEMLGNWSFGDYFKKEACHLALKLLTDVYRIPLDRLYFTYFAGNKHLSLLPDLETKEIWLQLRIPAERILPFDVKDNFWEMGNTGSCGPCTEIHYDHIGHRDAAHLVNTGSSDVVEIWNLVFMEYNRMTDQSLQKLPRQHVDTGLGLERLCSVLSGSKDNYSSDLFQGIFNRIHKASGSAQYIGKTGTADVGGRDEAYRIVADHIRMSTIAIGDGLLPSRDGLGHKLRHVIHRALHQAHTIFQAPTGFFGSLVNDVAESLEEVFPECFQDKTMIQEILDQSERHYLEMLQDGYHSFERLLNKLGSQQFTDENIIQLAEGRFGRPVPVDVLCNIAWERGYQVDVDKIQEDFLKRQLQPSLEKPAVPNVLDPDLIAKLQESSILTTDDHYKYLYTSTNGVYSFTDVPDSCVVALIHNNSLTEKVSAGDKCAILLNKTSFYAEAGGQQSDLGHIVAKKTGAKFQVTSVQQMQNYVLHFGQVQEGSFRKQDLVGLQLEQDVRQGCMCNHTATHLLNSALQQILTSQVRQLGSSVTEHKFTFDFSCLEEMSAEKLSTIEKMVQSVIRHQLPVYRQELKKTEVMALDCVTHNPNEIYPDYVSLISVGLPINELRSVPPSEQSKYSQELCTGTHVHNTSDIGQFIITNFSGVSHSTKRMTCITGRLAADAIKNLSEIEKLFEQLKMSLVKKEDGDSLEQQLKAIYAMLGKQLLPKVSRDRLKTNVTLLQEKIRQIRNADASSNLAMAMKKKLDEKGSAQYVICHTDFDGPRQVRKALRHLHLTCPIVAVSSLKQNLSVAIVTPKDWNRAVNASAIGQHLGQVCGGKGKISKEVKPGDPPMYFITMKGSTDLETVLSEANNYLHNITVETQEEYLR